MHDLLPCVEIGSDASTHSIIWLHGLGADGHDFEPIVNELNLTKAIRFIFLTHLVNLLLLTMA